MPASDKRLARKDAGAHQEWVDRQHSITFCLFCDWSCEGTAAETREAASKHRASNHPEAKTRSRRGRNIHWPKHRKDAWLETQHAEEVEAERQRRARLHGIDGELV